MRSVWNLRNFKLTLLMKLWSQNQNTHITANVLHTVILGDNLFWEHVFTNLFMLPDMVEECINLQTWV